VTYFDTSASDDFAEFDKAFIALFQVVSGNTWIDSLPTHSPEGSVNFGNVSLHAVWPQRRRDLETHGEIDNSDIEPSLPHFFSANLFKPVVPHLGS
jgi:hypothetical protein